MVTKSVIGIIITGIVIVIIISLITSEIQISETMQAPVLTNNSTDEFENKIQDNYILDGYKKIQAFSATVNKDGLSFHLETRGKIPSYNELNVLNSTLGFGYVFSVDINVEHELTGPGHINGYMIRLYPSDQNVLDRKLTIVNLYQSQTKSNFCVPYIQGTHADFVISENKIDINNITIVKNSNIPNFEYISTIYYGEFVNDKHCDTELAINIMDKINI